jgi:uncharacterized protein YbjT (DUF2867 family)
LIVTANRIYTTTTSLSQPSINNRLNTMSKLLVIIGATGKQGGSVIKSILSDPAASKQFKLRGVTRDTSKDASKVLADQGVEMVAADLDDKASLVKAFEGAYGVYAVTDFWATMDKDTEVKQGKNMADAAKVCSRLSARCTRLTK